MLGREINIHKSLEPIQGLTEVEIFNRFTDFTLETREAIISHRYLNGWIIPDLIEKIETEIEIESTNTNTLLSLIHEYYPYYLGTKDTIYVGYNIVENRRIKETIKEIIKETIIEAIKKYTINIPEYSLDDIRYLSRLCINMIRYQSIDYDEWHKLFFIYIGKNLLENMGFITNISRYVYNKHCVK